MTDFDYSKYRDDFEKKIIMASINENKIFKKRKVPAKKGRLYNTDFANFLGEMFEHEEILAIDYYGFFKKSSGFLEKMISYEDVEIKSMRVPVAHFASIKVELVSDLAPELVVNFSTYKRHLLKIRGFKDLRKS